jgi:catechol-2,3-dioxygenase
MNGKIIILSLIIFLAASFFYLALVEQKQADLNSQNFWILYFSDPKGDGLDFVIENYSDKNDFHWEFLADKNTISTGNVAIPKGDKKIIELPKPEAESKKITVIVSDGEEKKEIYKNF